ncbi:Holliday junction branch migration protein RuvA [Candidatus Spongiihabitans sp.]|uniref:Holliday junction branch migration protein RuvA n=1 Tax=Candidatus Spongiihabitans sp. TaxID=3101308 RepID=UPI003C7D4E3A
MIGFLRGLLLHKQPPILLVEVNGVGYELEAPMSTFYALPDEQSEVALYVHLIVREDAQLLYGFSDQGQRQLFRSLLKINGVGARVALAILSTFSPREFIHCIHLEDAAALTRVPGIGNKTAERMIIDLRDRIDAQAYAQEYDAVSGAATEHAAAPDNPVQDAIGALMALGYKAAEANRAVNAVKQQNRQRDDLIRNALQYLAKR